MINNNAPIGVADSGIGGISVLKELIRHMPNENYLYFGDNKNAPYGTKTAEQVRKIMLDNAEYLMNKGIKALVVACNTATGASIKALRERYPHFPIIGIEPAIKPSARYHEHSNVLVMATPLTLKQEKFHDLLDKFSDEANIIPLPCPGLMELVESGEINSEKTDRYLNELFASFKGKKIDSVVLGCTHYPHIKKAVAKALGNHVMIFDGGEGTARETQRRLDELGILNMSGTKGTLTIEASDPNSNMALLAQKLLNAHE